MDFNPMVSVQRETADYGVFSYVVEGSAKIHIDNLNGYDFANEEIRNKFETEVEKIKSSIKNAPDNFDDEDRENIRNQVQELLISYYESSKFIK